MRLSEFDYDLPAKLIATHPTSRRTASRLLCQFHDRRPADKLFSDFPTLLRAGDLLVFNDTRVIRARLRGNKASGGKVEMLMERLLSSDIALAHVKASKSPKAKSTIELTGGSTATVLGRDGDLFKLRFDTDIAQYLKQYGEVPLPPYLGREAESADDERYQTVYARSDGAVAAPTAGLHFDDPMLTEIATLGIERCFVTLHVGAATFQNLREEQLLDNRLHSERVLVTAPVCEAIKATRARNGRVVAVGTTTVRALETAARHGSLEPYSGESDLFITPGYEFRSVDALLTNFHLPKSSLLMLVAAFAGFDTTMAAYRHAVSNKYRFFSYGDAMFIVPHSLNFA